MVLIMTAVLVAPIICLLSWQVGLAVAVLLISVSMFPIEGFKETSKHSERCLIKLDRPLRGDNIYYVEIRKNKAYYAFDNSSTYGLDGGAYEEKVVCGTIKVYESEKCQNPVLKVFKTKPVREIFAIAPFSTKIEYVFYVPKGKVLRSEGKQSQFTIDVV